MPHWQTTYRWLFFGVVASLGYAMWGFFDRFSTFQSPVLSNLILTSVTGSLSLLVLGKYRRSPARNPIFSGLCGGMINILVLYGLLSQMLVLVFPFVSFGTVCFMFLHYVYFRPSYSRHQQLLIYSGTTAAVAGLALCGIGISGGMAQVAMTHFLNLFSVALGLAISVFTGLWIFFAYLTISEDGFHPLAAAIWVFLGSLGPATLAVLLNPHVLADITPSAEFLFPITAGAFMFIGEVATYYAFMNIDVSTNVEELMVVVLANGELIPVMLLSYLVLHESSNEGFLGAALVLMGLIVLNKARQASQVQSEGNNHQSPTSESG